MKFQYQSKLGVKLLLMQCSYKKDLALFVVDAPSSPGGRTDEGRRVIFLLNPIHQATYFPCQCIFQKPMIP